MSRALIPDLGVLQAFECAARHENFTKAAAELNLTQGAVSRQIKILKAQLDVLLLPVASPSLIESSAIKRIEELANKPLLHLATRPRYWAEWFEHSGLSGENAYRGDRFDQFAMIIEASLCGLGFALLPLYLIEDEVSSGRLRIVFDIPMSTNNSYYVVLPDGKQENTLGRAFQSWLLENVGPKAGGASQPASIAISKTS